MNAIPSSWRRSPGHAGRFKRAGRSPWRPEEKFAVNVGGTTVHAINSQKTRQKEILPCQPLLSLTASGEGTGPACAVRESCSSRPAELSAEGPDPPPVEELDPWLPRILQGEIDAPCRAISQGCCRYARKPPRYDPVRRELWVDGDCVLQLSPLDATQHAILKAFQDRGWPETVSFDDVYQEDASREDGRNN